MSESDLHVRATGRIGTVLGGKYKLDSVLGVGGMAVVFGATHRNQKRVAIKVLHPELSVHEELRTRFLREGYAANTVDHPGAVAVLDDDTAEDGSAFLVMERLEGDELDRLFERNGSALEPDVVLAVASQLLDVLSAAHGKAIIHRDIKPSNLYVQLDGTLKVLDFGIARVRDAANTGASATSTGMMLGTPAYMAPEQALGRSREIDATTDLWSVGATMFTLLSGRFVHEGESVTELVVMSATTPARSLATVAPEIDPRVVALVDRALAFQQRDRWPSALAMRDAVRATYAAIYGTKIGREPLTRLLGTDATEVAVASTMHAPSTAPPPFVPGSAPLTPSGPRQLHTKAIRTMDEPSADAPRTREMTSRPSIPQDRPPMATPMPTQDMGVLGASTPEPVRMFGAPPARASHPSYAPPPGYAPGGLVLQQHTPPPTLHGIGATTAHAVASEHAGAGLPSRSPWLLPVAVFAGALVVAIGLWLGLSQGSRTSGAPTTSEPTAKVEPAAPPPPEAPAVSPPASVLRPAAVEPPPPVAPRPVAPLAPLTPAPSPRPAGAKPSCDPPYTISNSGIRVPKKECL